MTLIMTLVTLKIGKDHLTEIRSTAPANVWTFMIFHGHKKNLEKQAFARRYIFWRIYVSMF